MAPADASGVAGSARPLRFADARRTAYIVTRGESVSAARLDLIDPGATIVVKEAARLVPDAAVLYAAELDWFMLQTELLATFAGERWCGRIDYVPKHLRGRADARDVCAAFLRGQRVSALRGIFQDGLCRTPGAIHLGAGAGRNSGLQAIGLAWQWGARRIVLVGFDLAGGHFSPDIRRIGATPDYNAFRESIGHLAQDLVADGVDVINASPSEIPFCRPAALGALEVPSARVAAAPPPRPARVAVPPGQAPICYASQKRLSQQILAKVAGGMGWPLLAGGRHQPQRGACFYGVTADTLELVRAAWRCGQPWWYVDHAYFGRGEYYRVTRNALQHSGTGASDGRRLRRLSIEIQPWRSGGRHILVCPQSERWHEWLMDGDTPQAWAERVTAELRKHTDRPIVVRYKPQIGLPVPDAVVEAKRQLDEAFEDCHAVVVHQSGVGIQAAIAGVPVFALGAGAVSPMACDDLAQIEQPLRPDGREAWAAVLADNQWTLAEMADGTMRRMLDGHR